VYVEKERGNDKFDAQLASEGLCGPSKIWIGKDYVNFICKDFCDLDNPFSGVDSNLYSTCDVIAFIFPAYFFCFVLFKFLWHLPGSFFILLKSLWHLYTVSEQPQLSS